MSKYLLSPAARDDLRELRDYLVRNAGTAVAQHVLEGCQEAMARVADLPGAGHFREDLTDQPLRFYRVYRYLIIYNPNIKPVEIVRLLHGARDVKAVLESE